MAEQQGRMQGPAPEDAAVYGWAARWSAARIAQCFNDMPKEVAERIAAAATKAEVLAIMSGE